MDRCLHADIQAVWATLPCRESNRGRERQDEAMTKKKRIVNAVREQVVEEREYDNVYSGQTGQNTKAKIDMGHKYVQR